MIRASLFPLCLFFLTCGAVATATTGLLLTDLPAWMQQAAADWGPAFLILAGLAAGVVHYVPRDMVPNFVKAQQDQAVALVSVARSLHEISGQGGKIDRLQNSLDDALINQRVMITKLNHLEGHRDG